MEQRLLGCTGVSVSNLCLGTMMFGAWGNPDHDESIRIIHRALDSGINFVDTADVYSAGESEAIVAKALAGGRRDDVVLATKVHFPMGDDPNRRGNSRRWIMREVEDSLRRLGTDWIDLYQIHRFDPDTDIVETLGALSDLVHQGKVRYVGSSTFPASAIVEAQWTAHRRRCVPSGSRLASTCRSPRTSASSMLPTGSHSSRTRPESRSSSWRSRSSWRTPPSPRRSSGRARWSISSPSCPRRTSCSTTRSSTGSTRSSDPAPT
jgi:aryl-alcohol dehydrogenase-like predicted oxidoreductase